VALLEDDALDLLGRSAAAQRHDPRAGHHDLGDGDLAEAERARCDLAGPRSTEPVLAASWTSCCSSSLDSRDSVNVVRSPNSRRNAFETSVSSHTSGRISWDSATSGRATKNE